MPEHTDISSVIRKVDRSYQPSRDERVVLLENGEVVRDARGEGLWQRIFGAPDLVQAWVVRPVPPSGQRVGGVIEGTKLRFSGGGVAPIKLIYDRVQVLVGQEERLVLALHDASNPHQELESKLSAFLSESMAALKEPSTAAWTRVCSALIQEVGRRLRENLGLRAEIRLESAERPGRITYGPFRWNLPLKGVADPLPFTVEFALNDDLSRIPARQDGVPVLSERDQVRELLAAVSSSYLLEDFRLTPGETRSGLRGAVQGELVNLARTIESLRVEPAADVVPPQQLSVRRNIPVDLGDGSVEFALDLLLECRDAGKARDFQVSSELALPEQIAERSRQAAVRKLAGVPKDVLFGEIVPLLDEVVAEIRTWADPLTGYRVHHGKMRLLTAPPRTPTSVALDAALTVEPVSGRPVQVGVRAMLKLADTPAWLRQGALDVREVWRGALQEAAIEQLHTLDEAGAVRLKEDLERVLQTRLCSSAEEHGYRLENFRLDLANVQIPYVERVLKVTLREAIPYGNVGETVQVDIAAMLSADDPWAWLLWRGERQSGWQDGLVREIVADELRYQTRQDLLVNRQHVAASIQDRFVAQVGARGYKLPRFRLEFRSLPMPAKQFRERISVTELLLRPDDEVTWTGSIELAFQDVERWVFAGEPDPGRELRAIVSACLRGVIEESQPGDVDDQRQRVEESFKDALRQSTDGIGYRLVGVVGHLTTTNAPPAEFQIEDETFSCIVGQRRVQAVATVRLQLISAAAWRASDTRDLQAWLKTNIHEVVKGVLLEQSYAEVLEDVVKVHHGGVASISTEIQAELEMRASMIGYAVQQVLAFPDKEARDLLSGFTLSSIKTYDTSWGGDRNVKLQLDVNGQLVNLGDAEVRKRLSRGESVKDWLLGQAEQALQVQVRDLTPNDVFFRWGHGKDDKRKQVVGVLQTLLDGYGVKQPVVQLTQHPPPYIQSLRKLRGGGPYTLQVRTPHRAHTDTHYYEGAFLVEGLDERGADNLFSRDDPWTPQALAESLGAHLSTHLLARTEREILEEDVAGGGRQTVFDDMVNETRAFCGEHLGLGVVLVTFARRATSREKLGWLRHNNYLENEIDIYDNLKQVRQHRKNLLEQGRYDEANKLFGELQQLEMRLPSEVESPEKLRIGGGLYPPLGVGNDRSRELTQVVEVVVEHPQGGYLSTEPRCYLELTVRLSVLVSSRSESFENDILEATQRALRELLRQVEPAQFWLEFDHLQMDGLSVERRIRHAVVSAIERLDEHLPLQRLEITPPSHRYQQKLHALADRHLDVAQVPVELDNCQERGRVNARVLLEGVAPRYWRMFHNANFEEGSAERWISDWLVREVRKISLHEGEGNLSDRLKDKFSQDFSEEFGLVGVLKRVELTIDQSAPPLLVTVRAPEGGYKSAENSFLELTVLISVRVSRGQQLHEVGIVRAVQSSLIVLLETVQPARFWLAIDRPEAGGLSVSQRVEDTVRRALAELDRGLNLVKIDLVRPPKTFGATMEKLTERPWEVVAEPVAVKGARERGKATASFSVNGVAAGRWEAFRKFSCEKTGIDGKAAIEQCVALWLERTLSDVEPQLARQDLRKTFSLSFKELMAQDAGLDVSLEHLYFTPDNRAKIKALQHQRDDVMSRLISLNQIDDEPAKLKISELKVKLEAIDAELVRLQRGDSTIEVPNAGRD